MSLTIKDEQTLDLMRRLAAVTGESMTEAVRIAVQRGGANARPVHEKTDRLPGRPGVRHRRRRSKRTPDLVIIMTVPGHPSAHPARP